MAATIQARWNHNPGCVYIVAQKRLDRRDRSEPSYEHKLLSSVLGGARCPQLTRLIHRPAYRSGVARNFFFVKG